jgi:hypothetical protein
LIAFKESNAVLARFRKMETLRASRFNVLFPARTARVRCSAYEGCQGAVMSRQVLVWRFDRAKRNGVKRSHARERLDLVPSMARAASKRRLTCSS